MAITTGTEKQIAWASEIKSAHMAAWNDLLDAKFLANDPMNRKPMIEKAIELASSITDASAWIDGRNSVTALMHSAGINRSEFAKLIGADKRTYRSVPAVMDDAASAASRAKSDDAMRAARK